MQWPLSYGKAPVGDAKDFINNMTHEFKTPISTIRISTDVFLKSPEINASPRLTQYANIIQEQNTRLNNQVEKVLQLAKIERDNFKLNLEETDLHGLVTSVLEGMRCRWKNRVARCIVNC
ncbi:MAG: hypothetical protein IPN76_19650 [Saprospiraceae bacterium]|nr:hypothetical protein [Saprospiraceae bacterium]